MIRKMHTIRFIQHHPMLNFSPALALHPARHVHEFLIDNCVFGNLTVCVFFKELILQSWQALMRNRLRSVLTMLGIMWGLVSVVILLAYGQGLGGSVMHAFMNMGDNVIVIFPGQTSMQAGGERAGKKIKFQYEDV